MFVVTTSVVIFSNVRSICRDLAAIATTHTSIRMLTTNPETTEVVTTNPETTEVVTTNPETTEVVG
jgi:galactitol-specific phosphotransferase system IIB component